MGYAARDTAAGEVRNGLPDQPLSAVIACADPNAQESVVLLLEQEAPVSL